jgi:hypothetical protein
MLGNPPPQLLQKHMPLWRAFAPARCAAFALALYLHLLHIPTPTLGASSEEESDGYLDADVNIQTAGPDGIHKKIRLQ